MEASDAPSTENVLYEYVQLLENKESGRKYLKEALRVLKDSNTKYLDLLTARAQVGAPADNLYSPSLCVAYTQLKERYKELEQMLRCKEIDFASCQENNLNAIEAMKERHKDELKKLEEANENLKAGIEAKELDEKDIKAKVLRECEGAQANLQRLLDEAKCKLNEANNSNNALKLELMTLKMEEEQKAASMNHYHQQRMEAMEHELLYANSRLRCAKENIHVELDPMPKVQPQRLQQQQDFARLIPTHGFPNRSKATVERRCEQIPFKQVITEKYKKVTLLNAQADYEVTRENRKRRLYNDEDYDEYFSFNANKPD